MARDLRCSRAALLGSVALAACSGPSLSFELPAEARSRHAFAAAIAQDPSGAARALSGVAEVEARLDLELPADTVIARRGVDDGVRLLATTVHYRRRLRRRRFAERASGLDRGEEAEHAEGDDRVASSVEHQHPVRRIHLHGKSGSGGGAGGPMSGEHGPRSGMSGMGSSFEIFSKRRNTPERPISRNGGPGWPSSNGERRPCTST
jgi:hypothetical protein